MDAVDRDADDEGSDWDANDGGSDEGGPMDELWDDAGQLDGGGAAGGSTVARTDSELEVLLVERDLAMLGPVTSAARLRVTVSLSSFPTSLAGRGRGTIVGPARILSTGSEGAQRAMQAAQKNKHRVHRIRAKRSLATALSGTVDERERVAVGMLATAVSGRARESMRLAAEGGVLPAYFDIGETRVYRGQALRFDGVIASGDNVTSKLTATLRTTLEAQKAAPTLLEGSCWVKHENSFYLVLESVAHRKALHKLRPFLVGALVASGLCDKDVGAVVDVRPKRLKPSSEGVAARSLLPTESDLDTARLRLRADGVLVEGEPMTVQEESSTCWTVVGDRFLDGLLTMCILDCAPSVAVVDVAQHFPASDIFVMPGNLQTGLVDVYVSFPSTLERNRALESAALSRFLEGHPCARAHALRCARADTWLWNVVDVVQALLNARSKQGNLGQDRHISLGVVLWCDAKYMGEEWSFFKLRLFAPDLYKSGVSLDALIGAARGHESAFLNVRLALFDRLQSAFRAKFQLLLPNGSASTAVIDNGAITGDGKMLDAFFGGSCVMCSSRGSNWKSGHLVPLFEGTFLDQMSHVQSCAIDFRLFKSRVISDLLNLFTTRSFRDIFKTNGERNQELDKLGNRLANVHLGIRGLFFRGEFTGAASAETILAPILALRTTWSDLLRPLSTLDSLVAAMKDLLHPNTSAAWIERFVRERIVNGVQKLPLFAHPVHTAVLPIVPVMGPMHSLMGLLREFMATRNRILKCGLVAVEPGHEAQAAQALKKDTSKLENSTVSPMFGANMLREIVSNRDVILGASLPVFCELGALLERIQSNIYRRTPAVDAVEHAQLCLELWAVPFLARLLLALVNDGIADVAVPTLAACVEKALARETVGSLQHMSAVAGLQADGAAIKATLIAGLQAVCAQPKARIPDQLQSVVQSAQEAVSRKQQHFLRGEHIFNGLHAHTLVAGHLALIREWFRTVWGVVCAEESGEAGLAKLSLITRLAQNGSDVVAVRGNEFAVASAHLAGRVEPVQARESSSPSASPSLLVCPSLFRTSKLVATQFCALLQHILNSRSGCGRLVGVAQSGAVLLRLSLTTNVTIVCFNRYVDPGCGLCQSISLSSIHPLTETSVSWVAQDVPIVLCNKFTLPPAVDVQPRDEDPVLELLKELGFAPAEAATLLDTYLRDFFRSQMIQDRMMGRLQPQHTESWSAHAAWLREQIRNGNRATFFEG